MPEGVVKTKREEHLWAEAKKAARKQYPWAKGDRFWKIVNGIFQKMKG